MKPARVSLRSEIRRSLSVSNLMTAAIPAVIFFCVAVGFSVLPALQALAVCTAIWATTTTLHSAAHGYYGWRYARGLQCVQRGDLARGRALLKPVQSAWGEHYDPAGDVRRAYLSVIARDSKPNP